MLEQINTTLKKYIERNLPVTSEFLTKKELEQKVDRIPFDLPENKPLRVVMIGDYPPVPCGGTHLNALGELNSVTVTKIKHKKGNTVVAYQFD